MLRVIQEALANVHRHADAKQVVVAIAIEDEHVTIKIVDDGKGIAQLAHQSGNGERPAGLGVPGMRARVRQFGGSLELPGAPGTTMSAQIPLAGNAERASRANLKARSQRTERRSRLDVGANSGRPTARAQRVVATAENSGFSLMYFQGFVTLEGTVRLLFWPIDPVRPRGARSLP